MLFPPIAVALIERNPITETHGRIILDLENALVPVWPLGPTNPPRSGPLPRLVRSPLDRLRPYGPGQAHWEGILGRYFGRHFGKAFWVGILGRHFGRAFWEGILGRHFGKAFWECLPKMLSQHTVPKCLPKMHSQNAVQKCLPKMPSGPGTGPRVLRPGPKARAAGPGPGLGPGARAMGPGTTLTARFCPVSRLHQRTTTLEG